MDIQKQANDIAEQSDLTWMLDGHLTRILQTQVGLTLNINKLLNLGVSLEEVRGMAAGNEDVLEVVRLVAEYRGEK